jgi:sugar/nucleoside kinase (ribokinase family)
VECRKELRDFLKQKRHTECKVTVLPDFFLDRLINLNWNTAEFSRLIRNVAKRKGGSIDSVPQIDMRGGNAINVASALANLDAKVTPIVCTSENGLQQIKYHFKDSPIDTSHIKIKAKASITTALEFKNKSEKTNVMIRDLGSLADFGPDNLDDSDYALMENADFTCLFNWAGTLKFGSALAQEVFGRVKARGKGKTYFDTADPTPNKNGIPELVRTVLKSNHLDILSVNENEAISFASFLDVSFKVKSKHLASVDLAMEAGRILAKRLSARIDLHTTVFSATLKGKTEFVAPAFEVGVLRATGAGDAWTAGNILGDKNGLSDECRLLLANAVSACYLSDPDGKHPTWAKLSTFLNNNA